MARSAAPAQEPQETERQSERLTLSVTPSERDAVYGLAATRGLSVSELLREMVLKKAVRLWARERAKAAVR